MSVWNSFFILFGGMTWVRGFMTGMKAGVSTTPPFVLRRPILPMRSLSLSSKAISAQGVWSRVFHLGAVSEKRYARRYLREKKVSPGSLS